MKGKDTTKQESINVNLARTSDDFAKLREQLMQKKLELENQKEQTEQSPSSRFAEVEAQRQLAGDNEIDDDMSIEEKLAKLTGLTEVK
jgi:hypothetical protein